MSAKSRKENVSERKRNDFTSVGSDHSDGEDHHQPQADVEEDGMNIERSITVIEEAMESLDEERSTTREEALGKIVECLQKSFVLEFLLIKESDLVRAMKNGLSSASTKEQILSARLLSMMCIIGGAEWIKLFKTFKPILIELIKNTTDDYKVKAAVIETLGICCFVWAEEEEDTKECLELFENIMDDDEDDVNDASRSAMYQSTLDMWCLLVTTLDDQVVLDEYVPNDIENIIKFLKAEDLELRLAAGEVFAFLCSVAANIDEENGDEYSPYNTFNSYFDVKEMQQQFHLHGYNRDRKINKKERNKQRHGFNDILQALQTGTAPAVSITLNKQTFSFSSWRSINQLNIFRNVLGSGFQHHMRYNPLLSQIFDIQVAELVPTMTKLEKKYYMSPSSARAKALSRNRNAGRVAKRNRGFDND